MKTKKILLSVVIFLAINITAISQSLTLRHANRLYNQLAYSLAIPYFEQVLETDSTHGESLHKLAECYRLTNQPAKAAKIYAKVVMLDDVRAIEKYHYGQCLMQLGSYKEAEYWIAQFKNDEPSDQRADNMLNAIEKLPAFLSDSAQFTINRMDEVNTDASEFSPYFYNNGLLFSSNRYTLNALENRHNWTNRDYYRVFYADKNNATQPTKPITMSRTFQNRFNVGPVAYDAKNNILYVTKNPVKRGRVIKSSDKQVKLRIYSYTYDTLRKAWTNEIPFEHNQADYNVAHPAISNDGSVMVFSSDMPGGIGGMDLYYTIKTNGIWSAPVNLGKTINTKGNELFPFLSKDNILFFASNGHEGIGGLDLYYCTFKDQSPGKLNHIKYPLNSNWDDFHLVVSDDGKEGYFVSNRPGGKGDDDIYHVNILKPFAQPLLIKGIAKNKNTRQPLENVNVALKDADGNTLGTLVTAADGAYSFVAVPDADYSLNGIKNAFTEGKNTATTKNIGNATEVICDLELEPYEFTLYCKVTDKKTGELLENVHIIITDRTNNSEFINLKTPATGDFSKKLEDAAINDVLSYTIKLEKEGYLTKNVEFTKTITKPGVINMHEELNIAMDKIDVGTDLAKIIQINPIYFDLAKWNIRPDAAVELDKIVKVMKENPNMVIELGSHTDCRGSAQSNATLSDKRAKSSAAYIVEQGIEQSRITGKGYGESRLVNDCGCEGAVKSNCTEAQHQQNRRTEFIIVKM